MTEPESAAKTAKASHWGLQSLPIGSPESRAKARALMNARDEIAWDLEPEFPTNVAEIIRAARERHADYERRGEPLPKRDYSQIPIPPGKENTPRGLLVAKVNGCRTRAAAYEAKKAAL